MQLYLISVIILGASIVNGQEIRVAICPRVEPLSPEICRTIPIRPQCRSDRDCPDGERCCAAPCGQRYCQAPIIRTTTTTTTTTTTSTTTRTTTTTRRPISIKPGVCPIPIDIDIFCPPNLQNACRSDQQCPGQQKCCRTFCNRYTCRTPIIIRPPRCPRVDPLPPQYCLRIRFPHCDSNRECRPGQLCCRGPCNSRFCQNSV